MKPILFFLLITISFCSNIPECKEPERPLPTKCVRKKNFDWHLIGASPNEPFYECTKSECKYPSIKFEECRKKEAEVDYLKEKYFFYLCMSISTYGPIRLNQLRFESNRNYTKAYEHFKKELEKYNSK